MCNSLIYGIPHHQLHRLQLAQNTAAPIITLTKKRSHITPVLIDLHWLPIKQRIEFKLLTFVFANHFMDQDPHIFLNFLMITNLAVLDCVPQIFIFFRHQDQITLSVIVHLPFVLPNYGTISPPTLRTVILYLLLRLH